MQPVRIRTLALRVVPRRVDGHTCRRSDDGRRQAAHRRRAAHLRVRHLPSRRARGLAMRFVTTTGSAPPVSFTTALFDGLAPDGGLYVPETIEAWTAEELSRLPGRPCPELGRRALRPSTRAHTDPAVLEAVIVEALNFEIPLVEVQPGVFA